MESSVERCACDGLMSFAGGFWSMQALRVSESRYFLKTRSASPKDSEGPIDLIMQQLHPKGDSQLA